jgi:hypothetical protein
MELRKRIKTILSEYKSSAYSQINEIDWEGEFSDVKQRCINPKDIVAYLNDVRANALLDYEKRKKFDRGYPFVHAKSSFFKKGIPDIDVDYFIEMITEKPNSIISQNEKIENTGNRHEHVYNTGLPALRGIVYDIENKKFHYVTTCPGAGACALICYALKGNYIRYTQAYDLFTKRLNYLLNFPEKYEEQMYNEIKEKCIEHNALIDHKPKVILRWNDSGDFFANRYVKIAENVINRLQNEGFNVDSYAYTKQADVAKNASFETTFSMDANKRELSKIDLEKQKIQMTVPKELFKDLNLLKYDDEKILKNRIAKHYDFDPNRIITYDELMLTPKVNYPKWIVVVSPKDGDDAATRRDVLKVLTLFH